MNRYYVIAEDGGRYGPADLDLLFQWAQEGRIASETFLEDEITGLVLPAGEIPELGLGGFLIDSETEVDGDLFAPETDEELPRVTGPASPPQPEPPFGSGPTWPSVPIPTQPPQAGRQPPAARPREPEATTRSGFGGTATPGYVPTQLPTTDSDGNPYQASGDSRTEVALAWFFGILGFVCCPGFSIVGMVLAAVANKKRQPGATAAMVVCIVATVLGVAGVCGMARFDF